MRKGSAITIYLDEDALKNLDAEVSKRADEDREKGLSGYSVTNRSKLASQIITDYFLSLSSGGLTITKIREAVIPVFERYGVARAELFGSFARGEQRPESDVDILIDEGQVRGLEFFRLQRELAQVLGRDVDLQSMNGRNQAMIEETEQERVVLYAS